QFRVDVIGVHVGARNHRYDLVEGVVDVVRLGGDGLDGFQHGIGLLLGDLQAQRSGAGEDLTQAVQHAVLHLGAGGVGDQLDTRDHGLDRRRLYGLLLHRLEGLALLAVGECSQYVRHAFQGSGAIVGGGAGLSGIAGGVAGGAGDVHHGADGVQHRESRIGGQGAVADGGGGLRAERGGCLGGAVDVVDDGFGDFDAFADQIDLIENVLHFVDMVVDIGDGRRGGGAAATATRVRGRGDGAAGEGRGGGAGAAGGARGAELALN